MRLIERRNYGMKKGREGWNCASGVIVISACIIDWIGSAGMEWSGIV